MSRWLFDRYSIEFLAEKVCEAPKPPTSEETVIDDPLEKIKQQVTEGDSDPPGVALSIGVNRRIYKS